MIKTFKQLQDSVLEWAADVDNDGLLLTLVKDALNSAQTEILTAEMFDFMLWPMLEEIDVESGQVAYDLHPLYLQGLYFYNATTGDYLEEVSQQQLQEASVKPSGSTQGEPDRFSITSVGGVREQPTTPAVVIITTTGGSESSGNSFIVQGIVDGVYREETLSSGSNWTTLTGTLVFDHIIQIIKVGETWTRTVTVTCNSQTVLVLRSDQMAEEYRQIEFLSTPTQSATVQYRFYRRPRVMVYDNEVPEVPATFSDLLKLKVLLQLQGYTRATANELELWAKEYEQLLGQMRQTYQSGRTLGARSKSVRYIPRV